jgi:hypothetical protein
MSPTGFSPGIGAVNRRRIRSGTAADAASGLVRFLRLRRVIPVMACSRISRATRRQPTPTSWRLSSRVIRSAP